MAVSDEDWNKFLDSIDETDDDVETDDDESLEDETDDDEQDDKKVTKKSKKAAKGAETDDDDDSDEDDDDETDDDEQDDDDHKKAKNTPYKPRLKQFLNDKGTLDAERIEKSYIENSKETVRINGLLAETNEKYNRLVEAIKAKPEAAKLLLGEEGAKNLAQAKKTEDQEPVDPYTRHIKAQLNKKSRADYDKFVEEHPESITDPEKARKIGKFLERFGRDYPEDNDGELPTMKEGLVAAYRYYGWDLKPDKREQVASAAKKIAATRHTPNKKTPAPKKKVSDMENFFAKKLNVKIK